MTRTIDARWIEKALSTAQSRGVEVQGLRARISGERIPEQVHVEIWGELMRATEPGFPIHVAEAMSIDDYDLLGLIGKTASTVVDALHRVERYLPIWTDAYTCRVVDRTVTLELDHPGSLGARCATESALAELTKALRDVSGAMIVPAVHLRHRGPDDVSAHVRFFGSTPQFSSTRDMLVLSDEDANRPVRLADRALAEYLEKQLDDKYAAHANDFTTRLRRAVRESLGRGIPTAAEIAERFALSTRTLHRRVDFGAVVEGEQLRLARELLRDPRLSLAEISERTGFSEPSAFSRAYRRWTGRAPSEDR